MYTYKRVKRIGIRYNNTIIIIRRYFTIICEAKFLKLKS